MVVEWDAGNSLEFYGSLIGAGGTIVLGCVAYWQTKRANAQAAAANDISSTLLKIEQQRYEMDLRPLVIVNSCTADIQDHFDILKQNSEMRYDVNEKELRINVLFEDDKNEIVAKTIEAKPSGNEVLCIKLSLLNTTNSIIAFQYNGMIETKASAPFDTKRVTAGGLNQRIDSISLVPGEAGALTLYAPEEKWEAHRSVFTIVLVLMNRHGEKYLHSFNFALYAIGTSPKWDERNKNRVIYYEASDYCSTAFKSEDFKRRKAELFPDTEMQN